MSIVRNLYRAARIANDVSTVASGKPGRIGNRGKNKLVGRALGRGGVWRKLWGRWL